jgi:hypothetical protein
VQQREPPEDDNDSPWHRSFKIHSPNGEKVLPELGRIAPIKGTHLAIEIAKRSDIPLKIAREIQPAYHGYFEQKLNRILTEDSSNT